MACQLLTQVGCCALLHAFDSDSMLQVLGRVTVGLGILTFLTMAAILVVYLVPRDAPVGFSVVFCFVIVTSVIPIGLPVVTTTVLAVGAREMANEGAVVSR